MSRKEALLVNAREVPDMVEEKDLSMEVTHQQQLEATMEVSVRDFQQPFYRKSAARYAWYAALALVALLDFLATAVADYLQFKESPKEAIDYQFESRKKRRTREEVEATLDTDPMVVDLIHFLDEYSIGIGLLFSLLWFTDAFVKARETRVDKLEELDRKHLLNQSNSVDGYQEVKGAWGSYYRTILIQCLFLPVSFFVVLHHLISPSYATSEILMDEDEKFELNAIDKEGRVDEEKSFTVHTGQSVIFFVIQYVGYTIALISGMHLKARIKKIVVRTAKRLFSFAIRHPRRFARRLRRIRTALRWLKYLTPLIGTGNKLLGNMIDLVTKYRQQREAKKLERVRQILWKRKLRNLSDDERKEQAAIMIQRSFRRYQAEKKLIALKILQGNKEQLTAIRLQRFWRERLNSARQRIQSKKQDLLALKRKQEEMKKSNEFLSVNDRRRLYQLQEELGTEARELLNQKMLLRPNTRFAVTWKILFVICVIFEITQLAFAPMLAKYVDEETGKNLDIEKVMELKLVPTPFGQREECGAIPHQDRVGKRGHPAARWIKKIRRKTKEDILLLEHLEPKKWYCHEPFTTIQLGYIEIVKLWIHRLLVFVGFICFMDVFVTFFTGELDAENGNLVPKPFVARWLIPGIVLQLIVNPQMETVSQYVWKLLSYTNHTGFIRVYRWTAAFFFPLFSVTMHFFIDNIWRPLVKDNNRHSLAEDPFAAARQPVLTHQKYSILPLLN